MNAQVVLDRISERVEMDKDLVNITFLSKKDFPEDFGAEIKLLTTFPSNRLVAEVRIMENGSALDSVSAFHIEGKNPYPENYREVGKIVSDILYHFSYKVA